VSQGLGAHESESQVTCIARAACWRCAAILQVSGADCGQVMRALGEILAEDGWGAMAGSGLRLCPSCAALEPRA
jgi:hypothetical protein